MNHREISGSLLSGSTLLGVAALGWAVKALFGPDYLDPTRLQSTGFDCYLYVIALVGVFHLVEGLAEFLVDRLHRAVRRTTAARLRRNPFPDALAEPDPRPAEWSSPQQCPRCGTVRPSAVPCCPRCCSPWW